MSGLTSGRGYYVGIAKEVNFGTGVAPAAYLRANGIRTSLQKNYVESQAKLGSRGKSGATYTNEVGEFSLDLELYPDDIGFLLKGLLGTEVIAQQGGTAAWRHTFTLGAGVPSWTLAFGQGGVKTVWGQGAVVDSLSLEVAPGALITGSVGGAFRQEDDTKTPTTPTYASLDPVAYRHATATWNAAAADIQRLSLQASNNLKRDDFRMDGSGLVASINPNEFSLSGSMEVIFGADGYGIRNDYKAGTYRALVLTLDTGVLIDTGYTYKLTLTMPRVLITRCEVGDENDGAMMSVDWTAFLDSGTPITAVLDNARTTVY